MPLQRSERLGRAVQRFLGLLTLGQLLLRDAKERQGLQVVESFVRAQHLVDVLAQE